MTDQVLPDPSGVVELPDDPTTAAYWEAAREGRLTVQRCAACGIHQFYPRPVCLACGGRDLHWVAASGRAEVYSVTTVQMRVADDLEPPYQVALVDLDEGVRMLAIVATDACALAPGDAVRVELVQRAGRLPRLTAAHDHLG